MGVQCALGKGTPKDMSQAYTWYCKAAKQGHVAAQRSVGDCLEAGKGVPVDQLAAAGWYRKAAEQNDALAQQKLGMLYSLGKGLPRDLVEAHCWFNVAGANGSDGARKLCTSIELQMSSEELEAATKLAHIVFEQLQSPKSKKANLPTAEN